MGNNVYAPNDSVECSLAEVKEQEEEEKEQEKLRGEGKGWKGGRGEG